MKYKHLALIVSTVFSIPAVAAVDCSKYKGQVIEAKVSKVDDGDTATIELKSSGTEIDVRFFGADTPESEWKGRWPAQPFSREAKQFTVQSLRNKTVNVTFTGEGTYSRCVGEIFINGQSHSLALVKGGYAWWYSRYAPNREDLEYAHRTAERSKVGLWANPNAKAPWDYRRQFN